MCRFMSDWLDLASNEAYFRSLQRASDTVVFRPTWEHRPQAWKSIPSSPYGDHVSRSAGLRGQTANLLGVSTALGHKPAVRPHDLPLRWLGWYYKLRSHLWVHLKLFK